MPKKKARPVRAARRLRTSVAPAPDERVAIAGVPEQLPERSPGFTQYSDDYSILLKTAGGAVTIRGSAELRRMAMQWSYRLRNRARWHNPGGRSRR